MKYRNPNNDIQDQFIFLDQRKWSATFVAVFFVLMGGLAACQTDNSPPTPSIGFVTVTQAIVAEASLSIVTSIPTETPTFIPTPAPITPTTATISDPPTIAPTFTPVPQANSPTSTFTPVPPPNTSTFTPVPPPSTSTFTPVPPPSTSTFTPVPPTDTPTATPTSTFTPIPPTDTPTATPTMSPSVCVDSDAINFGGVKLDNLKPGGFTITNCGSGSLIINISLEGSHPGDFTLIDFMKRPVTVSNALLNGNEKCTIYLMFKPGGLGNREAFLTIQSNVPGRTIRLAGLGLPPDEFGTSISPLPSVVVCSDRNS